MTINISNKNCFTNISQRFQCKKCQHFRFESGGKTRIGQNLKIFFRSRFRFWFYFWAIQISRDQIGWRLGMISILPLNSKLGLSGWTFPSKPPWVKIWQFDWSIFVWLGGKLVPKMFQIWFHHDEIPNRGQPPGTVWNRRKKI